MKVKVTLSEILFYSAIFLTVTGTFFKQTQLVLLFPSLSGVFTVMTLLAVVILMIKALYDNRYNVKKMLFSLFIGSVLVAVAFVSGNVMLPLTLLAYWATINNVPFRRVVIVVLTLVASYMLVTHFAYLAGEFRLNNDYRPDGQVRYAAGYVFVTFVSNYLFHVLLMWWYIRQQKLSWIEIGAMSGLTLYVYRLTDTRSALLFSFLAIFIMVVVKLTKRWEMRFLTQFILKYGVTLIGMVPIVLTYAYNPNNAFMAKLNSILTDRLYLGKVATELFKIKPFGQGIEWTFYGDTPQRYANGNIYDYLYVDSAFVNTLLNYGFILLCFIFIAHYALSKLPQFNQKYFALVILIVALHAMFDPQLLEIQYNPFILALGYTISPIHESQ
ncbi:hypothetical protein KG089_04225 [Carnobacteriaceae bacterium zg-ZUI252]|nr:hypothetical protein [Carnobacteriaceae bacterium zg-ZUI252]